MSRLDSKPLFIILIILTLISYLFSILAFIVSKWYAMYPGSMSTFQNIGLWEICFSSFMNEEIYDQLYSDCFYIRAPEISDLYNWIVTDWFLASQITYTLSFISLMVASVICTLMSLDLISINRLRNGIVLIFMHGFGSITCLSTLILFGVNTKNLTPFQWMPNPSQCSLSWSYGSAALSLLGSIICLGILANVLISNQDSFLQWGIGKKAKYHEGLSTQIFADTKHMDNIPSMYDPRGYDAQAKSDMGRDQSLISSKLTPAYIKNRNNPAPYLLSNQPNPHEKLSKSRNNPTPSIMSNQPNPHVYIPKIEKRSAQEPSSTHTKHPKYQKKPDLSILSNKSEQTSNLKTSAKISSPPASQLTLASRNTSSVIIAAKPMRKT